jgi:hypothetical protein
MTEVARELGRVADAIEAHNERDRRAAQDADARALRDLPRVQGAMQRGLARTMVRQGLFHTAIPRSAWDEKGDALTVRCNCGAEHVIDPTAFVELAECGRWFMFDGTNVRVAVRPQTA